MAQCEEKKKFGIVELEKDPQIRNNVVLVNFSWVRGEETYYGFLCLCKLNFIISLK